MCWAYLSLRGAQYIHGGCQIEKWSEISELPFIDLSYVL